MVLSSIKQRACIKFGTATPPRMDLAGEHASFALASIALQNGDNMVQITGMLVEVLVDEAEKAAHVRAVRALEALVQQNPTFHDRIAKAGPMNALVELLKHGIAPAKDYALWSLSLSITRADQPVIAEAGGVLPLIAQLADQRVLNQEQASHLCPLMTADDL
jgi:hypothetical protein